jgi:SAM-dependent methyltransferase
MTAIYCDGEYLMNNRNWHAEDSAWKARQISQIIDRNNISFHTVMEVGCGAGEILNELSSIYDDEKCSFDGFDISPQAISMAKQNENPRIRYFLEDPLFEKNDKHHDLLLMIDVFEHVRDYMGFVGSCKAKADYKIFHIPLELSVSSLLRNTLLVPRRNVGHLHYFTAESALATLKEMGHEIIDHNFTCGALDLYRQHPSIKTTIANVPRWLVSRISAPLSARLFGGFSLLVLTR